MIDRRISEEAQGFSLILREALMTFSDVLEGSVMPIGIARMEGTFSPRMDIKETKGALTVTAELPGMDQKEIDVSVHDGVLTISGEKKVGKEEKGTDYHYIERSYGCFSRSFSLPDTVETEKIGRPTRTASSP